MNVVNVADVFVVVFNVVVVDDHVIVLRMTHLKQGHRKPTLQALMMHIFAFFFLHCFG